MEPTNVNSPLRQARAAGVRHSILDLAPLELECMTALWALGEATVRDIHGRLAERRPRAYTTVLTIMDRLANKGVVERRKAGRAFRYKANLSAEDARLKAIDKIVEGFFNGSREALADHLARLKSQTVDVLQPLAPAAVDARGMPASKS